MHTYIFIKIQNKKKKTIIIINKSFLMSKLFLNTNKKVY